MSLERSVAIGRWWAYTAPALSATGAVALIVERATCAGYAFLFAASPPTFNSSVVVARQPALFTFILAVAAACWAGGTLLWIDGGNVADVTGWWIAFLILTIAAERLELGRVLSPPRSSQLIFAFAAALIIAGLVRGELSGQTAPFSGGGLLLATVWLVRHDVAFEQSGCRRNPDFRQLVCSRDIFGSASRVSYCLLFHPTQLRFPMMPPFMP